MNANRKAAIAVGVLYIIGTVSGVLSVVISNPILDAPDFLSSIAANPNQVVLGASFVLTMGLALAIVPVAAYPVLKQHNQTLAMGYVVFRGALETVGYMATVICTLLLVALSREYVAAGMPDGSGFQALGGVLAESSNWITQVGTTAFILGALMFYWVLYRAKLIPRWISGWGLITAVPYFAAAFLVMFGVIEGWSSLDGGLRVPLGLQEMVMAVWLIVKGFNPPAIGATSPE